MDDPNGVQARQNERHALGGPTMGMPGRVPGGSRWLGSLFSTAARCQRFFDQGGVAERPALAMGSSTLASRFSVNPDRIRTSLTGQVTSANSN